MRNVPGFRVPAGGEFWAPKFEFLLTTPEGLTSILESTRLARKDKKGIMLSPRSDASVQIDHFALLVRNKGLLGALRDSLCFAIGARGERSRELSLAASSPTPLSYPLGCSALCAELPAARVAADLVFANCCGYLMVP